MDIVLTAMLYCAIIVFVIAIVYAWLLIKALKNERIIR